MIYGCGLSLVFGEGVCLFVVFDGGDATVTLRTGASWLLVRGRRLSATRTCFGLGSVLSTREPPSTQEEAPCLPSGSRVPARWVAERASPRGATGRCDIPAPPSLTSWTIQVPDVRRGVTNRCGVAVTLGDALLRTDRSQEGDRDG